MNKAVLKPTRFYFDEAWEQRFEELVKFRREKPGMWPRLRQRLTAERSLHLWCKNQHMQYVKGKLAPERVERLEAVGFFKRKEEAWFKVFRGLQLYVTSQGHFPPSSHFLYNWIKKELKNPFLQPAQKKLLDELMQLYQTPEQRYEAVWDQRLREVEAYFDAHGRGPDIDSNPSLYKWLMVQRSLLRKNKLPAGRQAKLSGAPHFHQEPIHKKLGWAERLAELEAFITEHGRYPRHARMGSRERSLYNWCIIQRLKYRGTPSGGVPLTTEQNRLLRERGFPFNGRYNK